MAETPLIIPAPVGTYVLHVIRHKDELVILQHVCTHFERFKDRLVPRSILAMPDEVIEAAVLHPTGHVSGSPTAPFTFENVEQYRHSVHQRHAKKNGGKVARARIQFGDDLVG